MRHKATANLRDECVVTVRVRWFLAFGAFLLVANLLAPIARADAGGGHEDPIASALLALAVILISARIGAHLPRALARRPYSASWSLSPASRWEHRSDRDG
jgi:hypothetical protein